MGKLTVKPLFFWVIKNIVSGFSPLNQSFVSKNEVSRMPVSHWSRCCPKKQWKPRSARMTGLSKNPVKSSKKPRSLFKAMRFFFPVKHRVHIEIKRCGRCGRCQVTQRCEPFGTGCPFSPSGVTQPGRVL